jgi:hypothetical protein
MLEMHAMAAEDCLTARSLDPSKLKFLSRLARAYLRGGRLDLARQATAAATTARSATGADAVTQREVQQCRRDVDAAASAADAAKRKLVYGQFLEAHKVSENTAASVVCDLLVGW